MKLILDVDEIRETGSLQREEIGCEFYLYKDDGKLYLVCIDSQEGEVNFAAKNVDPPQLIYIRNMKWAMIIRADENAEYIGNQEEIKDFWNEATPQLAEGMINILSKGE